MEYFCFGKMDIEGESCPCIESTKISIPDIDDKISWLMEKYGFDEAGANACLDWYELIQKQDEI